MAEIRLEQIDALHRKGENTMNRKMLVSLGTVLLATAILLALLTLLAQSDSAAPQPARAAPLAAIPAVTEVAPSSAPNDLDTAIVISGTDFVVSATVLLNDTALDDVGWVSAAALTATVPWGMEPGVYTLTVETPGGGSGSWPNAFTVTQSLGVWTTNGPYGGSIGQLTLHPVTPTTIYALGWDVGIFVSDDAGNRWEMAFYKPSWHDDYTFDAQDTDLIYVGDDHALYRTLDGTQTWDKISIRPDWWEHTPAAHPTQPNVVFAAVGSYLNPEQVGGVFRSDDQGDSWITLTVGLTDTHFTSLAIHPVLTQTMVAGTVSGNLFYSLDSGQTWNWTAQLTDTVASLYFNPFEPLQVWATTGATAGGDVHGLQTLYKSENLLHWTIITVDNSLADGNRFGWDIDFISDTIWATTAGAYFSTDDGATWTPLAEGPCVPGRWLAINPVDPLQMYGGSDLGVCKSDDGGTTWRRSNEGLAAIIPADTVVSPDDPDTIYVRAAGLDLAKSENGGRGWRVLDIELGGGPHMGLAVDPFIADRVYANTQFSTDGGKTWQQMTFTSPITSSGYDIGVTAITPHPTVPGHLLAGYHKSGQHFLCTSTDYGENWNCPESPSPLSSVTQIAYDAQNPDLVYAGTWGESGLWISADGGQTWDAQIPLAGFTEVWHVFTHPNQPGTVYVFVRQIPHGEFKFLISENAGETWNIMPDGPGGPFYFAPTQPRSLYTSCYFNNLMYLCRSWDGGHSFEVVNEVQQEITTLSGGTDGERVIIYVGTKGGVVQVELEQLLLGAGVYRWTSRLPTARVYLPLILKGYGP